MRIRSDELELPGGVVIPNYYVRESFGFVMVFALTPAREVVLVRQYRYGIDDVIVELPAGSIDRGEDALACGQRELAEETGYTASRWEHLATIPAEPVRSNSLLHAFLAFDATPTGAQALDLTEAIEPFTVPLEELRHYVTGKRDRCGQLRRRRLRGPRPPQHVTTSASPLSTPLNR